MEYLNNEAIRFLYEANNYVLSVERQYVGYDSVKGTDVFNITVVFHDGQKYSWRSNTISRYGNGLFVDSKGKYLFGCSLQGIYCCDLKTGTKLWHKKKMSKYIVMNNDDTLTCEWHKQIFILDVDGNVIDELNTNFDTSVFHIGENKFLIRINSTNWNIVTSNLDTQYVIPNQLFHSRIRFANIIDDTLIIKYWSSNYVEDNLKDEHAINLLPYKII